ncbi:MAG: DegV family protein [Candidatus Heimdallarchaeota archaeon]|nr:DegV family protein [Candidatus Heimdallarchaeota archaeon]MCK4769820.1 DegV family protein [Candidatus Heimdallarchaeota archaeon]
MTSNFAIVVDSTSDLPEELLNKYDFTIVPAWVVIGDNEFRDRVDIKREKLLHELVTSEEKITTTQPRPLDFINAFEEILKKYDKALFLGVSTKLSATYQNAVIASKQAGKDRIVCIDTLTVTHGAGFLAHHAALRREQGMDLDKVVEEIMELKKDIGLYFFVENLDFLLKGGRIGKAKHMIGTLLNKKPLLFLNKEGEIDSYKSVKGIEAGFEEMKELVIQYAHKNKNFVLGVAYGEDNKEFEELGQKLKEKTNPLYYSQAPIGPGVLCHVGPNIEAVIFMKIPDSMVDLYK